MSDDKTTTPTPPQTGASPEPFARKAITWGRMPQTTFHVGPVPIAPDPLARIKVPPKPQGQAQGRPQGSVAPGQSGFGAAPRAGGGILAGSLIPQARPAPTPPAPTPPEPIPTPPAELPKSAPDLTVRPLPGAEPNRAVAPAPTPPSRVEPVQAAAPLAEAPIARVEPRVAVPSDDAAPTPVLARKTVKPSRLPLYVGAGVVAALVIGGGLWFALKPEAAPTPTASAPLESIPAAPAAPASIETPLVEAAPETVAAPAAPAPAAVEEAPAPRPAVTTQQPTAPTPRPATPAASTPPPSAPPPQVEKTAPPPVIETAPLVVVPPAPAPTVARPAQTDPDAPVVTRPQPLD